MPALLIAVVIGMAVGPSPPSSWAADDAPAGVFLAIATLGFAEAVRIVLLNVEWTGGAQGLAVP